MEKKDPWTFRQLLREVMTRKNLRQDQLAALLGVSQPQISKMLNTEASEWEGHFIVFMKLLPICIELKLIGETELFPDGQKRVSRPSTTTTSKTSA
jgi:transcriptional regulator with XRE-family HTH domain